jgi:hypothetical protein
MPEIAMESVQRIKNDRRGSSACQRRGDLLPNVPRFSHPYDNDLPPSFHAGTQERDRTLETLIKSISNPSGFG